MDKPVINWIQNRRQEHQRKGGLSISSSQLIHSMITHLYHVYSDVITPSICFLREKFVDEFLNHEKINFFV